MGKRVRVLVNPHSGIFRALHPLDDIVGVLRKRLPNPQIVVSKSEREARAFLSEALRKPTRLLVLAGGDGTVHAAAQALAGSDIPIGIVPLGTANNIAAALGIPADVNEAVKALERSTPRKIDLGRVGGRYFVEAAGLGFHADALALYDRHSKKSIVRSMYAFAKTFLESQPVRARLNIDGEALARPALQITFSNLPLYGSGFSLAPDARADDGLLDVTVIGNIGKEMIMQYLLSAKIGAFPLLPEVEIFRGKRIAVETDRPVNFHVDAAWRRGRRFQIKAVPGAILVLGVRS